MTSEGVSCSRHCALSALAGLTARSLAGQPRHRSHTEVRIFDQPLLPFGKAGSTLIRKRVCAHSPELRHHKYENRLAKPTDANCSISPAPRPRTSRPQAAPYKKNPALGQHLATHLPVSHNARNPVIPVHHVNIQCPQSVRSLAKILQPVQ